MLLMLAFMLQNVLLGVASAFLFFAASLGIRNFMEAAEDD